MIVVTGAAGHLGNNLVRVLQRTGETIRCLVLASDNLAPLAGLPVEIAAGDVRDFSGLERAFAGARLVYHLASVISIAGDASRLQLMDEVNVGGARNVAAACRSTGVGRLVHVSSIHALREPPPGVICDETQPFDPSSIRMAYGNSKARGTLEVLAAAAQGLDAVVACPTGIIGPHDYRPSEMGKLILDYAAGRLRAIVPGAYDFVDVRDVAEGLVSLANHGNSGEHYILSGERITVVELVQRLRALIGYRGTCVELPPWMADAAVRLSPAYYRMTGARPRFTRDALDTLRSNSVVSHAKATNLFGYDPLPLAESLADTVAWFTTTGRIGG